MQWDKLLLKIFLPDDESWLKHANPWSVWTRFATLPFIILAIWSRVWIGWYCLMLAFGLWKLNLYVTLHATTAVYFSKMWFLDRMVWLYEDCGDHDKALSKQT